MKYLYKDTMCVSRIQEQSDEEDGTTGREMKPLEGMADIPCHISSVKLDDQTKVTVDGVEMITKLKIFCDPKYEIIAGDQIVAIKKTDGREATYTGVAGKPVFGLTQEFILLESTET